MSHILREEHNPSFGPRTATLYREKHRHDVDFLLKRFAAVYPTFTSWRNQQMEQFDTGAKRSERQRNHFHLIPSEPLRRLARRYALGSGNYGEYNWLKGFPFSDLYNHVQDHLENAKKKYEDAVLAFQGDEDAIRMELKSVLSDSFDDDLAGAAWGLFAIMELARRGRITPDGGWQIPVNQSAEAPVDPKDVELRQLRERNTRLQDLIVQQEIEHTFSPKAADKKQKRRR
jgi:hypothetical protein